MWLFNRLQTNMQWQTMSHLETCIISTAQWMWLESQQVVWFCATHMLLHVHILLCLYYCWIGSSNWGARLAYTWEEGTKARVKFERGQESGEHGRDCGGGIGGGAEGPAWWGCVGCGRGEPLERRKECVGRRSGGKKCGKGREGWRERRRTWNGGLV